MASASSHTPVCVAQTAAARRSAGPRDDLGPLLGVAEERVALDADAVEPHGPLGLAAHRDLAGEVHTVGAGRDEEHGRRGLGGASGDEDGGGPVGADHERLLAVEAPPVTVGGGLGGGDGGHGDVGGLVERERRAWLAPAMTSGSSCLRCASLPNSAIGIADATMLLRYGTGATVRPICSAIRQASRMP